MNVTLGWRAGAASDPGLLRDNNEDRVFVDESAGIFLVVDGMGGRAAGEMAAQTACDVISQHLRSSQGDIDGRIRKAITVANNEIYRMSRDCAEWRGMACVLTLAVAHEDRITLGHVGDSRLYLVWNGTLRKLTPDHSLVGELEDGGKLTEGEAMAHPKRNEVFRDVGSRPREASDDEFIEIRSFPFRPSAALLLCTDGFSDMLTTAEINAIVQRYSGDSTAVARELVSAANRMGGKDNITVVFIAGLEFLGERSEVMAEARNRNSITQVREVNSRWRRWLHRVGCLLGGSRH
jgi:serine/threonine protein phosphatase PrpC